MWIVRTFRSQCPQSSPKSSPKRPSAPQHPTTCIRPSPPVPAPRSTYGESRSSTFQRGPLRCYNCNRLGHVAKDCQVRPTSTAAMEFQEHPDLRPQQRYYQQQEYPRYGNRPPYSSVLYSLLRLRILFHQCQSRSLQMRLLSDRLFRPM